MSAILQATSSYLGAFLASGCFATAIQKGSEVVLWPLPTEDKVIITEAAARLPIENQIHRFAYVHGTNHNYFIPLMSYHSIWGAGDSEKPFLAVARKDSSQIFAVDVFDCRNDTCIKTDELRK